MLIINKLCNVLIINKLAKYHLSFHFTAHQPILPFITFSITRWFSMNFMSLSINEL